jgi:hypothetical protein
MIQRKIQRDIQSSPNLRKEKGRLLEGLLVLHVPENWNIRETLS